MSDRQLRSGRGTLRALTGYGFGPVILNERQTAAEKGLNKRTVVVTKSAAKSAVNAVVEREVSTSSRTRSGRLSQAEQGNLGEVLPADAHGEEPDDNEEEDVSGGDGTAGDQSELEPTGPLTEWKDELDPEEIRMERAHVIRMKKKFHSTRCVLKVNDFKWEDGKKKFQIQWYSKRMEWVQEDTLEYTPLLQRAMRWVETHRNAHPNTPRSATKTTKTKGCSGGLKLYKD